MNLFIDSLFIFLQLKDILETAFNNVSFDNDECSGVNFSFSHTDTNNVSKSLEILDGGQNMASSVDFGQNLINEKHHEVQTPMRHLSSAKTKPLDFGSEHETQQFSDQFRSLLQNGTLHDIVDASGGGGDADTLLHHKHCIRSNSLGMNFMLHL